MKKLFLLSSIIISISSQHESKNRTKINEYDASGYTLLHNAIRRFDIKEVRRLLAHPEIDPNKRTNTGSERRLKGLPPRPQRKDSPWYTITEQGYSPIELAGSYGFSLAFQDLVNHPKVTLTRELLINTALYAREELLQILLNKSPNLELRSEAIKILEKRIGNLQSNSEFYPSKRALKRKLAKLQTGAKKSVHTHEPKQEKWKRNLRINTQAISQIQPDTNLPLTVALQSKTPELTLWNIPNKVKQKEMHEALEDFIWERFIQQDPNEKIDNNGNTTLHISVLKKKISMCKRLLEHPKINLRIKNNDGDTARDLALKNKDKDIIQLFLDIETSQANTSSAAQEDVEDDSGYYY